jgi:hypothetical protein
MYIKVCSRWGLGYSHACESVSDSVDPVVAVLSAGGVASSFVRVELKTVIEGWREI